MSVVEAVERDLDALRGRAPDLADSAIAASALKLAEELDKSSNSATSKSMCAKALADAMTTLRELAPPAETRDGLDELRDRRNRARGSAA